MKAVVTEKPAGPLRPFVSEAEAEANQLTGSYSRLETSGRLKTPWKSDGPQLSRTPQTPPSAPICWGFKALHLAFSASSQRAANTF